MNLAETNLPQELTKIDRFKTYELAVVASESDACAVTDRCKEISDHIKRIEKQRKSLTEPILEAKRRIDEQAKSIILPLEGVLTILKSKLLLWHQSQEKARIEAETKKREEELAQLREQKKADLRIAMVSGDEVAAKNVADVEKNIARLEEKPIEIFRNTRTAKATTAVTTYWDFEIEDESKIPDEYWVLDTQKIGQVARTLKESASVPGVRFVQKQRMMVR